MNCCITALHRLLQTEQSKALMTTTILDWIFHLDTHLASLSLHFGLGVYALLFAVIFIETGLVIMPFLPGDSLLFVSGALAANGQLRLAWLIGVLSLAAIAGDTVNYAIGTIVRSKALKSKRIPFLKPEHLERTRAFFDRHGNKAIILARFVPVVRTLAPFVAALGSMHYGTFLRYNIVGGVVWISALTVGGFTLGNVPWIKDNLTAALLGIVALSILPGLIGWLNTRQERQVTSASKK
jgi:membrane-associated protein